MFPHSFPMKASERLKFFAENKNYFFYYRRAGGANSQVNSSLSPENIIVERVKCNSARASMKIKMRCCKKPAIKSGKRDKKISREKSGWEFVWKHSESFYWSGELNQMRGRMLAGFMLLHIKIGIEEKSTRGKLIPLFFHLQ